MIKWKIYETKFAEYGYSPEQENLRQGNNLF